MSEEQKADAAETQTEETAMGKSTYRPETGEAKSDAAQSGIFTASMGLACVAVAIAAVTIWPSKEDEPPTAKTISICVVLLVTVSLATHFLFEAVRQQLRIRSRRGRPSDSSPADANPSMAEAVKSDADTTKNLGEALKSLGEALKLLGEVAKAAVPVAAVTLYLHRTPTPPPPPSPIQLNVTGFTQTLGSKLSGDEMLPIGWFAPDTRHEAAEREARAKLDAARIREALATQRVQSFDDSLKQDSSALEKPYQAALNGADRRIESEVVRLQTAEKERQQDRISALKSQVASLTSQAAHVQHAIALLDVPTAGKEAFQVALKAAKSQQEDAEKELEQVTHLDQLHVIGQWKLKLAQDRKAEADSFVIAIEGLDPSKTPAITQRPAMTGELKAVLEQLKQEQEELKVELGALAVEPEGRKGVLDQIGKAALAQRSAANDVYLKQCAAIESQASAWLQAKQAALAEQKAASDALKDAQSALDNLPPPPGQIVVGFRPEPKDLNRIQKMNTIRVEVKALPKNDQVQVLFPSDYMVDRTKGVIYARLKTTGKVPVGSVEARISAPDNGSSGLQASRL